MQPPPSRRADPLRCDVRRDDDAARVRLLGDLDVATASILSAEIDRLRAGGVRRMILDLSNLGFMDSSGLRCILEYDAEARQDGFSLDLVPAPPVVQRVFELTRTHSRLSFIEP